MLSRDNKKGCKRSIYKVCDQLSFGQGNRKTAIVKSRGISTKRVNYIRRIHNHRKLKYISETDYNRSFTLIVATSIRFKAGNCLEYNILLYSHLLQNTTDLKINFLSCVGPPPVYQDHCFIVVGDVTKPESCFILDAWDTRYNFTNYMEQEKYYSPDNKVRLTNITDGTFQPMQDVINIIATFPEPKFRPMRNMDDYLKRMDKKGLLYT